LGKVKPWDAFCYIFFQFLGGLMGIFIVSLLLEQLFTKPPINYIVTVPGSFGWIAALIGELVVAFIMMMMVLIFSNDRKLNRYTGIFAGFLVTLYIIFEAPISGFGMNPARSFASALPAGIWTAFWLYVIAPPLGMLLAAEVYRLWQGKRSIMCAKLHHENNYRCIFCCDYKRTVNLSDRLPKGVGSRE
jgi:aquaporin Z